jgi:hypothetical protein
MKIFPSQEPDFDNHKNSLKNEDFRNILIGNDTIFIKKF